MLLSHVIGGITRPGVNLWYGTFHHRTPATRLHNNTSCVHALFVFNRAKVEVRDHSVVSACFCCMTPEETFIFTYNHWHFSRFFNPVFFVSPLFYLCTAPSGWCVCVSVCLCVHKCFLPQASLVLRFVSVGFLLFAVFLEFGCTWTIVSGFTFISNFLSFLIYFHICGLFLHLPHDCSFFPCGCTTLPLFPLFSLSHLPLSLFSLSLSLSRL